ncbi:MAG: hypothetical protein K9G48_12705 [Reyranella sp.]|nr:hypothetical protein [Reyranella sp.]
MTLTAPLDIGADCPVPGCKGGLDSLPDGECTCFRNPPCPACQDAKLTCDTCGHVPAMPTRFRARPVEIEAMRFEGTAESANAIEAWMRTEVDVIQQGEKIVGLMIKTEVCSPALPVGAWVVRNRHGEFAWCDDEVINATYERVP